MKTTSGYETVWIIGVPRLVYCCASPECELGAPQTPGNVKLGDSSLMAGDLGHSWAATDSSRSAPGQRRTSSGHGRRYYHTPGL